MHKRYLFFLYTLIVKAIWNGAAQARPGEEAGKSYLGYYRAVALAEEAVVGARYADALLQYRQVFAAYMYNNPIDCYVAAQVAAYTGDTALCLDFLRKGLCFGLPPVTIRANPHLGGYFMQLGPRAADSCRQQCHARTDQVARSAMITLIKADQQLIRREGAGLYERAGYRVLKPAYRAVWDSFIREVIRITQTSGFPAQKVIGTQQGDDSLFRAGPNAVFVTFLFIHHGHAWSQVHELLWTELLKGNITPQMYGVICESSNGYPLYENPVLYFASRPCADNGCRNIIKERLAEINANRYEIGLCSYEVMQEKFSSMLHYRRWCTRNRRTKKPFFDFQCELNFQGID